MNEMNSCERASDLIAFVYNEASESEARDFELHLNDCVVCHQEMASFALVRESISAWRDEALSGFVSTSLAATTRRKSAIGALRQFFDLSPLWLKGATAFAVVMFCILAALAVMRVPNRTEGGSPGSIAATYTEQDVDRIVKEALAKHESSKQQQPVEKPVIIVQSPKPKKRAPTPSDVAKSRRPLTRAEREQLAAELRLLSTDEGLNLLGDRINQ
jgi:hypothetical protein